MVPGLRDDHLDSTATVIFTSGSTGDPKGVVLSHRNVLSNVHQIGEQVLMKPEEVLLGVLPFFHSFGFTITIWTAICLNKKVVYHFNPLDARHDRQALRAAPRNAVDGHTVVYADVFEELPGEPVQDNHPLDRGGRKAQARAWRDLKSTLNIEPLEGYGCTELSPVVAVNVPREVELPGGRKIWGNRLGTVGLPLPGTAIKTINPDTGTDLPAGAEGMIAVKGPQVMVGYLNRPEATAQGSQKWLVRYGRLGICRSRWISQDHRPHQPVF